MHASECGVKPHNQHCHQYISLSHSRSLSLYTKRRIVLEISWVYLKGMQCFVSEDRTISQQNACHKAYEERLKNRVKDVPKDENVGK